MSKTNYIVFKRNISTNSIAVKIDDTVIAPVLTTKFLGVIIDHKLNWKPHIKVVTNKVARMIGILSRIRYKILSKRQC